MELASVQAKDCCRSVDLDAIDRGVTEWDVKAYFEVISTALSPAQLENIATPPRVYPQQEEVLAVHWHPEFVPMDTITRRVDAMYPNAANRLIIPTQHNIILDLDGYSGVEVDCYSHGFNRKVQLLLHFETPRLEGADKLKAMLEHTFKYRSSQLFDYLDTLTEEKFEARLQEAAGVTNSDAEVVEFSRIHAAKLKRMIEDHWADTPRDSIKNKLIRNYFDALRALYDDTLINRAQVFIKAVKEIVKRHFSLAYFYRASEVIEEARALNAGIVIPHPEQFWPILLADYDVDGIEAWNPQSQEYTEFLIRAVQRQNKFCKNGRELLVFMGDDCHMSEKTKDPEHQNPEKAAREIGLQPAWDDLSIGKSLIMYGVSRAKVIEEYRARLAG